MATPINKIAIDDHNNSDTWVLMPDEEDEDELFVGAISEHEMDQRNLWHKDLDVYGQNV